METDKIGKYTITDDSDSNNHITNLSATQEDNTITIKWSYPKNPLYKLAVIFQTPDASSDLRTMLLSNCDHTTLVKNIQTEFTYRLRSDTAFTLYPATFGDDSEINIIDQQSGNRTQIFSKLVKVTYSISYRRIPLSNLKLANITISTSEPLVRGALYYKKTRDGHEVARYSLDTTAIKSGRIIPTATIRYDEQIKICSSSGYKNIELTEARD